MGKVIEIGICKNRGEEVKKMKRLPISILVENVRSVHNVGAIFRTADGFGAERVFQNLVN